MSLASTVKRSSGGRARPLDPSARECPVQLGLAQQMVVRGVFRERPETAWGFQRTEVPGGRRAREDDESAELPL